MDIDEEMKKFEQGFAYKPPSPWISVKDRLPEPDQTVLVYQPKRPWGVPLLCSYESDDGSFEVLLSQQTIVVEPSHWMPLPENPIGES